VLFYSTEAMQRWFARSERPCVVVGRLHDAVFPLSCIYPHSEAAGRHAAGLFYGRGHRHLVYLLLDKPRSLGNRICADAFAAEAARLGATAEIVTHEGGRSTVLDLLKRLLAARPHPMGFFVSDFATSLTTLCYLIHKGYRVPEQAALVCGWDDFCLQHTYPSIASYRADGVKLGRRLASSLLNLVQHGPGKVRAVRVLPEFVSGGSMVGE
jgi:DNA-binding LacI/PurR family transcriptional regulator